MRQERWFGFMWAAIFAAIGLAPLAHRHAARWWAVALAAAWAALAALRPGVLRRPREMWMEFAGVLNRVTTPVAMAIVFYLVVTPTGLLRRALGKDSLRTSAGAGSYWIRRDPPGPPPESMANLF